METTQTPMPLADPTLTEFDPSKIEKNTTYTVSKITQMK